MRAKRMLCAIVLSLLPALMLCGCMEAQIQCGVDADNTAALSYTVHVDRSGMESKEWIKLTGLVDSVKKHWQAAGFEAQSQKTDDSVSLTAVMKSTERNRQRAFDALLDMMRSDASPFSEVSGDYDSSYFSDEYDLRAACDFTGAIPQQSIEELPYNLEDDVAQMLRDSRVQIVLLLPGEVIETSGEPIEGGCRISAGFAEPAQVYLRTRIDNAENIAEYEGMRKGRDLSKKLVLASGITAVPLLIVFVAAAVYWSTAARQNRLAKQLRDRHFRMPEEIPSQIDEEE